MIGWLIAVLVVVLLLRAKVGIFLLWKDQKLIWKIQTGPFRWKFSEEQKAKRGKPVSSTRKSLKRKNTAIVRKSLTIIKDHWQELLELIGRVLRAPSMEHLRLHILAGGSDPAECAMNYGKICAGVSAVLPTVERIFKIKKRQIEVSCCYEQTNTTVEAESHIILHFGELIVLTAAVLRQLLRIKTSLSTSQKAV